MKMKTHLKTKQLWLPLALMIAIITIGAQRASANKPFQLPTQTADSSYWHAIDEVRATDRQWVNTQRSRRLWLAQTDADPSDARRRWESLSPEQKQRLRKRLEQWKNLDPDQKARLENRLERLKNLPPEQRQRVIKNWRRFKNLPPEKQRRIREKYKRWQTLDEEDKRRIRNRYQRYRQMSPEQRQQFQERRRQWQNLSPEQRQQIRERYRQKQNIHKRRRPYPNNHDGPGNRDSGRGRRY